MTKTRQDIIRKLKDSEQAIQRDADKHKISWEYGAIPKVYCGSGRDHNEALKMAAEGLIFEYSDGMFTVTMKGRKELLYPEAKAV